MCFIYALFNFYTEYLVFHSNQNINLMHTDDPVFFKAARVIVIDKN